MQEQEIVKIIDTKIQDVDKKIDEKINAAIELRKKQVGLQLKIWSGAITAVLSFMVFIGFTKEDIVSKVRDTILPVDACLIKDFHLDGSFPEKIITMLSHLKKDGLFDGSPTSLAQFGSGNLLRRKNMGLKSLRVVAHKLESLGVINDAKAWLEGSRAGGRYRGTSKLIGLDKWW